MTMNKKRHDDRPERRRSRCKRLAVLGFLTLGSNLGCGQNMLRLPAGPNGTLLGPAPIPYSETGNATAAAAASRKPEALRPVALKTDPGYGSSIEDLFLASYRDSNSYGPHLTKATVPRPSHGETLLPGGQLTASQESGIAPPDPIKGRETQQTALFSQPQASARQHDRNPAESPFKKTQIPPPQARFATPRNQTEAAASSHAPSGTGPMDLVAACGLTKIAPPRRGELTYFPDLEAARKPTGIGMPVSPANPVKPQLTTPTASQTEVSSPPPPVAELTSPPPAPVEVKTQSPTQPETSTPPTTPAGIPMDPPSAAETSAQTPAPAKTPSQPPTALELPAEPAAPAESPSQPPAALELPAEPPAPAETPSQPAAPVELPLQSPAPAETPSQPARPVDILADPPALPAEMPGKPTTPTEPPAAAEIPSEPATPAAPPNQPTALPEDPSQTPPPAGMPGPLPPLAEIATEPAVRTKETKVENPDAPFEDASTSPPIPSKPGPQEQAGDLSVAFEETKIPPPGQAASQAQGQAGGPGPDQIPLPPLQVDPSVFGTSAELPPPLPLVTPPPTVAASSECPACEILRKQKESDHWATGPVNQTIYCPTCEENQARSRAQPKSAHKIHDLDSALMDSKTAPPLGPTKVHRASTN